MGERGVRDRGGGVRGQRGVRERGGERSVRYWRGG